MAEFTIKQGDYPQIMGILNVTPDSFHDGGHHNNIEDAVEHGLKLLEEGADILDIGGESSRPGAEQVSIEEEINRVIPVIKELRSITNKPISIDTMKSQVAAMALENGATIVNDISAGLYDPKIIDVVAEHGVSYVAMHMRGTPASMQKNTSYKDLINEINQYFYERIEYYLNKGISRDSLILDPGLGFGKSLKSNYTLLAHLDVFRTFGCPLLLGPSRKSFISLAGGETTDNRMAGTMAAVTICVLSGVEIIRVHDVKESLQALKVAQMVKEAKNDYDQDVSG